MKMLDTLALDENFSPVSKLVKYIKYKIQFIRDHPNYFYPDGLLLFVGMQGSGKTLSAVNYVCNLMKKYPKAILVTNVLIYDYPLDYKRVFPFINQDDLSNYNNGEFGVIYLIDEIQLYWNSLQSKNINPEVMTQISQQRKQRKHIIGTSQVFGRMAKPLREQFSNVVQCDHLFKWLQHNKVIDRDSIQEDADTMEISGTVIKSYWFIHDPKYYQRYDTYSIISQNKYVTGEQLQERINKA